MDPRLGAASFARRRDELAALAMLALGQAMVWSASPGGDTLLHGPRAWNAVVLAATAVPLAWRRRAPLGAVVAVVVAFCLSHVVAPHGLPFLPGFGPLLVLTASAGWHARGRRGMLALAVALAGVAVCEASEPMLRHLDRVADALWLAVPWGLLRALRAREERVRRLAGELAVVEATHAARRREVVAAERARIARDLHDVVAHAASVMVIQVGAARLRHSAGESDIEDQLAAAEETGRQAIAELRRLLDVLRAWPDHASADGSAPEPPQPRLDQLGALVESYRRAGVPIALETDLPDDVPLGVQVSAYRIVQESLTNSLRHGAGRPATVRLRLEDETVVVDVTDAGPASAGVPAPRRGGGHGLVGMSERARLLGGSLSAGPNRSGGWTVLARLPAGSRSTRSAPQVPA